MDRDLLIELINYCKNIQNYNFLTNIDVSHIKNFSNLFISHNFKNIDFLSEWKPLSATTFKNMFVDCLYLENVNGIQHWKNNINDMFKNCPLINI